jgi:predicted phage tail protein
MDNQTVRTIRLYGGLGAKFGRVHRLAVQSTAEAIRALSVLLPGFEQHLIKSSEAGLKYACFNGRRNLREDQIPDPVGDEDIRIAPILAGAKNAGLFQAILGVALIAIAVIAAPATGGSSLAAAFSAGGLVGATASLGLAFFIGGVTQMLSPQQKGLAGVDNADNGASYNFNGPVNLTAEGNCRPVLYGRMICGSVTISAGFYNEDIAG